MTRTFRDSLRVLLLEDDEDDVVLTSALLREVEEFDSELIWANTFDGGLAFLNNEKFDIVLVDYRIGADTGIAWIEEAHRRGHSTPIIVLTGQGSREVDELAMQAGAADYLVKHGLDPERLGRSVRYAIDRAEGLRQLEASELRYRLLFERNPMPMRVSEVETLQFLAVNDAAIAHYGYSRQEFLQMSAVDVRPKEDIPRFLEYLRSKPPNQPIHGRARHQCKDGRLIIVETKADAIVFEGRPARLVLIHDISAKVAAEDEARLFARAFESSKSGMLIADAQDPALPAVYVNPAFARMSGYAEEEILGRNLTFLQGEDHEQEALDTIRRTLQRIPSAKWWYATTARMASCSGTSFRWHLCVTRMAS